MIDQNPVQHSSFMQVCLFFFSVSPVHSVLLRINAIALRTAMLIRETVPTALMMSRIFRAMSSLLYA